MRRRLVTAVAIAIATAWAVQGTAVARQARPNRAQPASHAVVHVARGGVGGSILVYAPTVGNGTINEATIATARGFDVTIATKAEWAAITTEDFQAFGAIVFADPGCKTSPDRLDAAEANAATWSTRSWGTSSSPAPTPCGISTTAATGVPRSG